MKATLLERWQCPGCDKVHSDSLDANNCCEPNEILICSVCNERFSGWRRDAAEKHVLTGHEPAQSEVWRETYVAELFNGCPPLTAYDIADRVARQQEHELFLAEIRRTP
jgi:hypothetical protein